MSEKIGPGHEVRNPQDSDKDAAAKEAALKKYDHLKHRYLTLMVDGRKIDVPLEDFVKEFGDPSDYKEESVKRWILKKHYGFK